MSDEKLSHVFSIEIGDWSGDGYEKSRVIWFAANKTIGDVRSAYHAAKVKFPDLSPDSYCNGYEESSIPDEIINALADAEAPVSDDEYTSPDEFADLVAWFCMKGDPDLKLERVDGPPCLQGHDGTRRIGNLGYGLLSD